MRIVVDENIPDAAAAFAHFGEVLVLAGRDISRHHLRDAHALIVRSVTRVDRALLEGTPVRFVGSTTAGIDHVALDDLAALGVRFAHAPGSNADSVVDYVLSVLALRFRGSADLGGARVGVVGCGQVGGRLLSRLRRLGIECCGVDPLIDQNSMPGLCVLEEVLSCDVVSLHVPLSASGDHATHHLLDRARLARMGPDALLINAARGPVVDNAALLRWLEDSPGRHAALDTWEFEPAVDRALLARCLVATPHIAGYALDGKFRGVRSVIEALAEYCGEDPQDALASCRLPAPAGSLPAALAGEAAAWQEAVLYAYDVRHDDQRLRAALSGASDEGERRLAFDAERKHYPVRREFSAWTFSSVPAHQRLMLEAAGFCAPRREISAP